jgi:histidine triad (HIT) family protein
MANDPDCIFCKIAAGIAPSFKIYEDGEALAFMDINPFNEGHTLAIPRAHFANLHEVDEAAMTATMRAAKRAAKAIEAVLKPDGINLIQANGPGAAQSVMHFHIHVFPRKFGDEASLNWGLKPGDRKAIGALAERLKAAVG